MSNRDEVYQRLNEQAAREIESWPARKRASIIMYHRREGDQSRPIQQRIAEQQSADRPARREL